MAVPYTFGSATSSIPLSQLDSNFATTITLGNTAIQLGNTVTTLNNMTLANVTISSGTSNLSATAITNGTSNVTIASSGGNISMATNGATAITVDTSQNVGIGTTSPTDTIGFGRCLDIRSSTGAGIYLRDSDDTTNDTFAIGRDNADSYLNSASGNILFFNAGSERMRIDSSGRLGVANSSPDANYQMTVGVTSSDIRAAAKFNRGTTSNTTCLAFANPNGVVGTVNTNGSATSYNTSSDYRLKESIAPMTGALDKVALLKPCTYKWKVDGSGGQGFIAHELQEVVEGCVTGEKDGEQMQGVDYGKLTPILTAALQEAIAKIETLEARIAVLEAK